MGWVESIQKAIDYMEEHLLDHLTIESISRQVCLSFSTDIHDIDGHIRW